MNMQSDPALTEIAAMLAKLDQAIRLLQEDQRTNTRPGAAMALAALESLRDDLIGKMPS